MQLVRFEIAPRSIALVTATIMGAWLFWELRVVVLILIVALILAGTFNPWVEWLETKGFKRISALLMLAAVLLVAAAGLIILIVPPMGQQIVDIVNNAPATREHLVKMLEPHPVFAPLRRAIESGQTQHLFERVEQNLFSYSTQVVTVIGYMATMLVLSFYLIADSKRVRGVAFALTPREYHIRLARILQQLEIIVGGYMRGQLITCGAIGVLTFAVLVACRVPNALPLALFATLVDVIPFVGGFLVVAPATLAALSVGVPQATIVVAVLLIYMEFESRYLVPRIYGEVLRMPSTAVILALIAGGVLAGIIGALLALPIAAALIMIIEELHVELPGATASAKVSERDAQAEAIYKKMSEGAASPDAADIARTLAQQAQRPEPPAVDGQSLAQKGRPQR